MLFKIVTFKSEKDNKPAEKEVSWEHFVSQMKHAVRAQKSGPAFSPAEMESSLEGFKLDAYEYFDKDKNEKKAAVYVNGQGQQRVTTPDGAQILRRNVNIKSISMAVIDYDQGTPPESIREKLADVNHLFYSTHSHTTEHPKFRVVVPLSRPITAQEFREMWPFEFVGNDGSCKDPARLYFLPACPPEKAQDAFIWSQVGKDFFTPKRKRGRPAKDPATKPEKAPKEKAHRPAKGKKLMDYRSMDAVAWFMVHGAYLKPCDGGGSKHWVTCPWAHNHTDGKNGETDAVLWTEPNKWPTFNCSHAHCSGMDIKEVMALWGDADDFCTKELAYKDLETKTVVRALGFDEDGRYYYQCNTTAHIVALRAAEHKELNFYSITADTDYWFKNFGDEDAGRVAWKAVAASLMGKCHQRGFFRLDRVRGGGVWEDAGRVVAHLGRHVLVDGKKVPLSEFKSDYTYEAAVHDVELPPPISAAESRKLLELASRLPFSYDQACFLAGMVPIGMLSGILDWRPHLWLTGDAQSGKSSVLTYFLNPLWSPVSGMSVSDGETTGAGIRQKLKRNAFPVIVDESEADNRNDTDRIESIIRLARSSSSVSDGRVLKGTTSGGGLEFVVRSSFVLCSIACALDKPQDKQRFTVLNCTKTDAHAEAWPQLKADLKATFTREFALGLYARVIHCAEDILENVKVMQAAVMEHVKNADTRLGEQLGTILAGIYCLLADGIADKEKAKMLIDNLGTTFERENDKSESNVAVNALQCLFSHIIREGAHSTSVAELVGRARQVVNRDESSAAKAILVRYGLRVEDENLYISSNHPQVKEVFRSYGIAGHHGLFGLLPNATKRIMRFGALVSKATEIPLKDYLEPLSPTLLPGTGQIIPPPMTPKQEKEQMDMVDAFYGEVKR